jgi:hypothetical protein
VDIGINAELLHKLVIDELRKILSDPAALVDLWAGNDLDGDYEYLQNIDKAWENMTPVERNKILQEFVKAVHVSKKGLFIELTLNGAGPVVKASEVVFSKGGSERRTAAYSNVREDSSTEPTHKKRLLRSFAIGPWRLAESLSLRGLFLNATTARKSLYMRTILRDLMTLRC